MEKFREALRHDPTSAMVYVQWGIDLGRQGDYNAAILKYKHALRLDPQLTVAYVQWAIALRENKDYEEAILKLEEVLAKHGESAWAHFQLGETRKATRDYAAAIMQYEKATTIDPLMTVAYLSWCSVLIDNPHGADEIDRFVTAANRYRRTAGPNAASVEALSSLCYAEQ